jgi:ribosomal protein S18 acetylase RimI-like enzyme
VIPGTQRPAAAGPDIREFRESDWPQVLSILQETFRAGDTYAFAPQSTAEEIHRVWVEAPAATFVACDARGRVAGTYFLKANQPGLGAHVCNCGYVVAAQAQGLGIAARMCEHSQTRALAMGFRAMQFNLVVATNTRAIRLWERLGFTEVGRLPGAFNHQQLGFVDALVMFKTLVAADS